MTKTRENCFILKIYIFGVILSLHLIWLSYLTVRLPLHKGDTIILDYTTIMDRLRTVSLGNNSDPTGVVNLRFRGVSVPLHANILSHLINKHPHRDKEGHSRRGGSTLSTAMFIAISSKSKTPSDIHKSIL